MNIVSTREVSPVGSSTTTVGNSIAVVDVEPIQFREQRTTSIGVVAAECVTVLFAPPLAARRVVGVVGAASLVGAGSIGRLVIVVVQVDRIKNRSATVVGLSLRGKSQVVGINVEGERRPPPVAIFVSVVVVAVGASSW